MKTLIIALNSKFIHSALAPWYLKASCGDDCGTVKVMEFSINDNMDSVLADIYREKADVAAFSCYIWNIGMILKLAENLRKIMPNIKIALGGPEVSFDAADLIQKHPFVDYIMVGEGELVFRTLLEHLMHGKEYISNTEGLISGNNSEYLHNSQYRIVDDLDSIPSPYSDEMLSSIGSRNRIVYFESSRGCPFSCSYCLSSTFNGVRYFSMDRVKRDLTRIIGAGTVQVKFVDRTFNCSRQRAKEIFNFIIEKGNSGVETNFHFEVAADLFDDEMFEILNTAPAGLIQFEIGVQTTNPKTLEAIDRKTDLRRLFENVEKLKNIGKTHLHMDLIAGLPEEDLSSFKKSFNEVYCFKPHQLQLGFLKMLKGSSIRRKAEEHGYAFRDYAPYEVLYNKHMGFDEILLLKDVEDMVERYYNSGRFNYSLDYVIGNMFDSAFEFYEELSGFFRRNGHMTKPPAGRTLYTIFNEFIRSLAADERADVVNELLKLDFLASDNSNNLPLGIERNIKPGFKEWCFDFLKNEENIEAYLPDYVGIPAKQVYKDMHFEIFNYDFTKVSGNKGFDRGETVLLFDYNKRSKVTGLYEFRAVTGIYS